MFIRGPIRPSLPLLLLACALPLLAGCASDDGDDPGTLELPARGALVCDWLNRRVDLVDLDALSAGATKADLVVATLDLSDYAQVPLNAEVTPDGKTALISMSDGFFAIPFAGSLVGASDIPTDDGRVLFVDLERFEVTGELETGDGPMGIAITPDGDEAIVAHFGSGNLAVVDLATQTLRESVDVGIYAEELAFDDSGEVGIVSYSDAGDVATFALDDLTGTLSKDIEATGDAAGVAFFPGTKTAYVAQAPMPLTGAEGGHDVVDVSDPAAPTLLQGIRDADAPIVYPATPAPTRGTVIVPTAQNGVLGVDEIALNEGGESEVVSSFEVGEANLFGAYGAVVDDAGRALLSVPAQRQLVVLDLDSGEHFAVDWQGADVGPMDVALIAP